MALCQTLGLSADECERVEVARCLSKPIEHFAVRNQVKVSAVDTSPGPATDTLSRAEDWQLVRARAAALCRRVCQLMDSAGESERSVRARFASAAFQLLHQDNPLHGLEYAKCESDWLVYLQAELAPSPPAQLGEGEDEKIVCTADDILGVFKVGRHAEAEEWRRAERRLSEAYVRLRKMIPGAFDTPHAPTYEQVWQTTEAALATLTQALASVQEEVATLRTDYHDEQCDQLKDAQVALAEARKVITVALADHDAHFGRENHPQHWTHRAREWVERNRGGTTP